MNLPSESTGSRASCAHGSHRHVRPERTRPRVPRAPVPLGLARISTDLTTSVRPSCTAPRCPTRGSLLASTTASHHSARRAIRARPWGPAARVSRGHTRRSPSSSPGAVASTSTRNSGALPKLPPHRFHQHPPCPPLPPAPPPPRSSPVGAAQSETGVAHPTPPPHLLVQPHPPSPRRLSRPLLHLRAPLAWLQSPCGFERAPNRVPTSMQESAESWGIFSPAAPCLGPRMRTPPPAPLGQWGSCPACRPPRTATAARRGGGCPAW
jgi:hypothetical protein